MLALPGMAEAAAARFVTQTGSDANDCTRARPCRTVQRALNAVPPDGQVQILDSGLYNDALTIGKPATIVADGVSAALGAVFVDTAGRVALRGLRFSGVGLPGANGITIDQAGSVSIEDCLIERFAQNGIRVNAPTALHISGTIVRENGVDGLSAVSSAAGAKIDVADSRFDGHGSDGIQVDTVTIAITRSVFAENVDDGLDLTETRATVSRSIATGNFNRGFVSSDDSELVLTFSESRRNFVGVRALTGGSAYLANNVIVQNETGVNNGATILSAGSNTIAQNDEDFDGDPIGTYTPE